MTLQFSNIPYHNNSFVSNQTTYWSGSDKKDVWSKHMQDPIIRNYLISNGWDSEFAIRYQFNSHGFRTEEFDFRPSILALGCSFTEGVGLEAKNTWPSLLSTKIGMHIWNLGVGGSSLDTCFRILDYYVTRLNITGVFLLEPPTDRVEIHTSNEIVSIMHTMKLPKYQEHMYKLWISNDNNSKYNVKKNLLAMKQICNQNNIFFLHRTCGDLFPTSDMLPPGVGGKTPPARDMQHAGVENQLYITNLFYEDYLNGNR